MTPTKQAQKKQQSLNSSNSSVSAHSSSNSTNDTSSKASMSSLSSSNNATSATTQSESQNTDSDTHTIDTNSQNQKKGIMLTQVYGGVITLIIGFILEALIDFKIISNPSLNLDLSITGGLIVLYVLAECIAGFFVAMHYHLKFSDVSWKLHI